MTLGERILEYRAKHRLSLKAFAELAGISLQTVWSIENEQQKPNRLTLKKIEMVLDDGIEHQQN